MTAPASGSPNDSLAGATQGWPMAQGVGLPLRRRPPGSSQGAVARLQAGSRD
jgi:hypothetical protein